MKRKIVTAAVIVLSFLLQCTIFRYLTLASIAPNLLVIVTSSFGFMRGRKTGMFVGLFSGLLMDIFFSFGSLLGFYGLIYMLIGYINGLFRRLFYDDDLKLPLGLIAASELLYGLAVYFLLFMMRSRFQFPYYLLHIMIPELVYTIAVTVVLYQIILKINQKLETEEKRSASKFV